MKLLELSVAVARLVLSGLRIARLLAMMVEVLCTVRRLTRNPAAPVNAGLAFCPGDEKVSGKGAPLAPFVPAMSGETS